MSFIDWLLINAKKCALLLVLGSVLGACSAISDKSEFVNQNEVNNNRLNVDKENVDSGNVSKNTNSTTDNKSTKQEKTGIVIPSGAKKDYDAALFFIDNKEWSNAITQLEQITVQHPELQGAGVALGWAHWQSGDEVAAVLQLQSSIDANKLTRADAYNYLAIISREQGKFNDAEALYKKAIDRWPNDPVLFENLGILYELYLGRLQDALSAYRQAQEIKGGTDKKLRAWIKTLARKTS